jgi:hypothetical protein
MVLFMGSCGGGGPTLHGLGKVELAQLCSDVSRCEARGDKAISTLNGRSARPIFLADKQGPSSYLGKVAPDRKAASVLKTCGGDVVRDDWLESGQTVRVLELTSDGKKSLRDAIKAHLGQELLAHPALLEGRESQLETIVEQASSGASLKRVSMVSQTYWLTDSAFEKRVGQCGEEEHENIIYSLTLLQLSEFSRKELESKIFDALAAKLSEPAPAAEGSAVTGAASAVAEEAGSAPSDGAPPEPLEPSPTPPPDPRLARRMALQERAFGAVRALASELRLIAALGYDEL